MQPALLCSLAHNYLLNPKIGLARPQLSNRNRKDKVYALNNLMYYQK